MAGAADLTALTIAQAREGLRAGDFSARELAETHIAAVEAARPLNVMIRETPEKALQMAEASDERLRAGTAGPLEGIPVAVKDLFCTEGIATTAGSHRPQPTRRVSARCRSTLSSAASTAARPPWA